MFSAVWQMLQPGVERDCPTFYAVGLFRLRPATNQLSLFRKPKSSTLARAMDAINNKYGEETIVEGELLRLDDHHAPDRIGFRKSVELDISSPSVGVE